MPTIGNTVRIRAEFRDFDGELVSPDGVVFRAYDRRREQIGEAVPLQPASLGVYIHDYIVPEDEVAGPIYYEVRGEIGGYPVVARSILSRSWS